MYLFYGPEAYIRKSALAALEKKVLMPGLESMNRTVMNAPSAQAVIENCETLPMMSDYRLIIVRDCALLTSGKAKDEAQESELLCEYMDEKFDLMTSGKNSLRRFWPCRARCRLIRWTMCS